MKKTVLAATIIFWCFMIGVVIAGKRVPVAQDTAPSEMPAQVAQAPAGKPLPEKQYTLKEVARHATAKDCWMAIGGKIYDFSAYIPSHPAAPDVMVRHCGKEATRAFETKGVGRPHSPYARELLGKYVIGALSD